MRRHSGWFPLWLRRPLLPLLGLVAIYAALLPLGPDSGASRPDLLYCLLLAWVIRAPISAPVWMVLALGLFADLMLTRPLGLGALGLLLATETARANGARLRAAPFLFEWLAVLLGFAAMLTGIDLLLRLSFLPAPGPAPLLRHLAATAIAYPLVVALLVWGFGIASPTAAPGRARIGRLS